MEGWLVNNEFSDGFRIEHLVVHKVCQLKTFFWWIPVLSMHPSPGRLSSVSIGSHIFCSTFYYNINVRYTTILPLRMTQTNTLVTNPKESEAFDEQFNRIVETIGLLPADVRAEVLDFPAQLATGDCFER